MTPRHLLLGAALLVAAGFAVFGDKSPGGAVVEPVQRSALLARAARASRQPRAPKAAGRGGDPAPGAARHADRTTAPTAAPPSAATNWTPPPPPPSPPPPPPPPSAPPLPFTYLGKALENGEWEVFLARGDETLIVRNKMVIDGVYRIDAIAPPVADDHLPAFEPGSTA